MVRQYIGARYVPKFMGTFDATQAYEALCVVDNGMGTSYISRVDTPAGTSLSDPTYWAVYGASSGAIVNLQNQVDALKAIAVTPEMFGAEGDGVTDDSQAMQDAMNFAKVVYLPKTSVYLIKDVTMPEGAILLGPGKIIFDYADNTNCITTSGNNLIDGVEFTDNGGVYKADPYAIISTFEVDNVAITNCNFHDLHIGYAALFEHCNQCTFTHNKVKDYSFTGVMALHTCTFLDFSYNAIIDGHDTSQGLRYPICVSGYSGNNYGPASYIKCNYNYIKDATPLWEGIDSHGAVNCEVIGNYIDRVMNGIAFGYPGSASGTLADNNRNVIIKNNFVNTYTAGANFNRGINVAGQATSIIKNVEISDNVIVCNDTVTAHTPISAAIGIDCTGGVESLRICNNTIDAENDGVGIKSNSGDIINILIEGNKITSVSTDSNYQGINLKDHISGKFKDVRVYDNTVSNAAGACMRTPTSTAYGELIQCRSSMEFTNGGGDYVTNPQNNLPAAVQAVGKPGDFIANKYAPSTTIAGYICKQPGQWLQIDGTAL